MANARSLEGLRKFLRRDEWRGVLDEMLDRHLAPACANADVTLEELLELVGDRHASILWGCVFEDTLAHDLDDGRNVVDEYLKRRGWKESASNKAYLVGLRSSTMSLYEISDIVLDQSFLARDLVRGGEPVKVSERSGTHYLKPWDRMAARLVQIGSRTEMAGGVLPFNFDTSEAVVKALRRAGKSARKRANKFGRQSVDGTLLADALSDTEMLRASAFLFTNIWLDDFLQRRLNPRLPRMCNTDGDEIAFTTTSYALAPEADAEAVRLALDAIPSLRPEGGLFWNWIGPHQPGSKKRTDDRTFVTTLDDGSLVLGTIELKGRTLVFEANSAQRAQRGRDLIGPVLGRLVDEPVVESRTVAQLMESYPTEKSEEPSSGLSPGEEQAALRETMNRYYMNLLDEPVPMLGNVTPRRAAKSAKGRDKLVTWLKLLENSTAKHESGSAMAGYDVTWMWKELGVSDLRR